MTKNGLFAILIALLIPLVCYFILKKSSDTSVVIPRHFLLDSVIDRTINGKSISDSIWHKTASISLVNQLGDSVSLYDHPGKITVIDFFFTHCNSICPTLTKNMSKLQRSFQNGGDTRIKIDTSVVQFISFSIDADRDSVKAIKDYAVRFGVIHDNWWMLTGNAKKIAKFAFEELKVDQYSDTPIDSDFVHTNKFVLLDKDYVVRGYYNGLDTVAISKLARDIGLLMLEKDKTKKSKIFLEIIDLKWLWAIIVGLVILFSVFIYLNNKNQRL